MEDAQIKSGNGLVKREESMSQESMSTADYFKAKKSLKPGTEEHERLKEKRKRQAGLRKILEGKARQLIQEDLRYR